MTQNVLVIGIAPYEEIKKRTLRIARGEYKPSKDEPKIWFSSIESLAQVLSSKNKILIEIIARMQPQSITELAELSGRHKSNLSRTLKTLQQYGIIELEQTKKGKIYPFLKFNEIQVNFNLASTRH